MSKPPPRRKNQPQQSGSLPAARTPRSANAASAPPTVSARWLITSIGLLIAGAAICAWLTLCLLFWQGSWQLLYHPASAVDRTPASIGLAFDTIQFADTTAGVPQLQGWWIPAGPPSRFTALYLHGANGNLGDAVDDLGRLHAADIDVFAFDYQGYGRSHFRHPNESRMRQDVESAIVYLTDTRHIAASSILLVGKDLGANLALEVAAAHPDIAGVVLAGLLENPIGTIFNDSRAHIVPARMLVSDRWDATAHAANLLIPSLWFYWTPASAAKVQEDDPPAYQAVKARKTLVWLMNNPDAEKNFHAAFMRWLDDLPPKRPPH
jgi:pimeloyl-ACP methyl ester carboxylesterase